MVRQVSAAMVVVTVFLSMFLALIPAEPVHAATISVPGDHATINAAIAAAVAGDTINVAAGTYNENINVDKSLTLRGAGSAMVTVNAANPAVSVFLVTANSVNISGFTVCGANGGGQAGIYISAGVANCNIHDNIMTGNFDGIWLGSGSNHNTLAYNTLSSNYQGFEVYIANYNTFSSNNASSNNNYGFKIDSGDHNIYTNNTANSNVKYGFYTVIGDGGGTTNSTFTNNTANLNTQYGMRMNGGNDNTLTSNTFNLNFLAGLRLKEAITNLSVNSNNIANNPIGIDIDASVTDVTSWTVTNNNIVGNTTFGISNNGTGVLIATNNWWGSKTGPGSVGSGTGDRITTNVLYDPWTGKPSAGAGTTPNGQPVTFATNGGMIQNIIVQDANALPGQPSGYNFPFGVFSFSITNIVPGSTVTITITLPSSLPANSNYFAYVNGAWVDVTPLMGSNDGDNIITLTLTDGGLKDADRVANGTIIDPGGPVMSGPSWVTPHSSGQSAVSAPPPPMPLPLVTVQKASLSTATSTPGTPVTVTADITNMGTVNGSKNVTLYVNGQVETTQGVTVDSGGSAQLTFSVTRGEPGTYAVYVDGAPAGSFKVESLGKSEAILIVSITLLAIAFVAGMFILRRRQRAGHN